MRPLAFLLFAVQPFELTVEVTDAHGGTTGRDELDLYLYPRRIFMQMPPLFTRDDDELDAQLAKRTLDYQWFIPHVVELEHRVVLPAGYAPPPLAPDEKKALGAMTLSATPPETAPMLIVVEPRTGSDGSSIASSSASIFTSRVMAESPSSG